MENNENKKICAECGGHCCKSASGVYAPEDFPSVDYKSIKNLLMTGKYQIRWSFYGKSISDNVPTYYLCPRHKGVSIVDYTQKGAVCIHLTKKGCALPFEKRPFGCKDLVPTDKEGEECSFTLTPQQERAKWLKYQELLIKLTNEFRAVKIKDLNKTKK